MSSNNSNFSPDAENAGVPPQETTPTPPSTERGAASATQTRKRKKLPKGALIGIIGGGAGAVIGTIAVAVFAIGFLVAPGHGSATPEEVVKNYLTALSQSNAKAALATGSTDPDSDALLTNAMLKASNKIAPLKAITVDPSSSNATYDRKVTAHYTLGSEKIKTVFSLNRDGNDEWKLDSTTVRFGLGTSFKGLKMTINGIEAKDTEHMEMFLGTYQIATATPFYTLTGGTKITVKNPKDYPTTSIKVELSEEGVAAFHEAVKSSLDACLAQTTLDAGCGLALPATSNDFTVKEGTVKRALSEEGQAKVAALTPQVSYDNPLLVKTYDSISGFSMEATCTKNGSTSACRALSSYNNAYPVVDFSTTPPTASWSPS